MLRHILLALSVLYFAALYVHAQSTPILTFNDHEYQYFGDDTLTWEEAESFCELQFGGHLVSMLSEEERQFVGNTTSPTDFIWTGLNDRLLNEQWMWTYPAVRLTYTAWAAAEPSSDPLNSCVVMNRLEAGKWSTIRCNLRNHFICKRLIGSCAWGTAVVGAPQPAVDVAFEGDSLSITVQVPQKHNHNATFYVGFEPLSANITEEEKCGINATNLVNSTLWTMTSRSCSATFKLNLPLEEFILLTNAAIIPQNASDIIRIEKTLYVSYFDHDATAREVVCAVTHFQSKITAQTLLVAEGSLNFRADNVKLVNPPSFTALSINSGGRLLIDLTITPNNEESFLSNFGFVSHSKGLGFDVNLEHQNCANPPQNTLSCTYRLNMISTNPNLDFSGILTFDFDFHWPTGNVTRETFEILLSYVALEQPSNLQNAISTIVSLVDSDSLIPISSFTPFVNQTILVRTNPPMNMPGTKFEFEDVFFCCTKGRHLLPSFNPALNHFGCTVQNTAFMSFWAQLVINGEWNPAYFVQPVHLGALVRDKIALSFSPISLFGEDKVCYIHATTRVTLDDDKANNIPHARSVAARKKSSVFISDAFQAVTLQSCSKEISQASCERYNQYCKWDRRINTCVQRDSHNAASSIGLSATVGLAFVVGMLALLF